MVGHWAEEGATLVPAQYRQLDQNSPSWLVRVLNDDEPSPSYWKQFLSSSNVPWCLNDQVLHGTRSRTLSSDTIRLSCLTQHGGVWLDVGIILLDLFPLSAGRNFPIQPRPIPSPSSLPTNLRPGHIFGTS